MLIEIKVPVLPESVSDATIAAWHKQVGDSVSRDENLVDLETDKVVLEVPATTNGVVKEILFREGDVVTSGQILIKIAEGEVEEAKESAPVSSDKLAKDEVEKPSGPGVRRLMAEHDVNPDDVTGTGAGGRVTKEDVNSFLASKDKKDSKPAAKSAPVAAGSREERRVPMTRLRAKVAERLLEAQHNAAMLTTFNEVDLKAVVDLRNKYKDIFLKKHGVKLGFMSFFVKAAVNKVPISKCFY